MSDNSDDIKKEEGTPKVKRGDRSAQIKQINAEAAKNMLPGIKTGSNELKAATDTSLMGRLKTAGRNLKNNVKNAGISASNKVSNLLSGHPTSPQGKVPGPKKPAPAQNSPESMAAFAAGKKPDRQAQMKEINASIAKPGVTSTVNLKGPGSAPQGSTNIQNKTQGALPMPGVNEKKDKLSKAQVEMLDLLKSTGAAKGKPGASEAAKAVWSAPVTEAEQKHVGKPVAPASAKLNTASPSVSAKPSVAPVSPSVEPSVPATPKSAPHEKLASHVAHAKTKNTLKAKGKSKAAKVDAAPAKVESAKGAPAPDSTPTNSPVKAAPAKAAPTKAAPAKAAPVAAKPAPSAPEQAHAKVKDVLKSKSKAKEARAKTIKEKKDLQRERFAYTNEPERGTEAKPRPSGAEDLPTPAPEAAKTPEKKFTPGAQKNLQSAPKSAEPAKVESKPEAQRNFKSNKVLPKGSPANQKAVEAQSAKQKMDTEKTAPFKEASPAKPDSWSSKGSSEKTEVTRDAKEDPVHSEVTKKPGTGTEKTAKPGAPAKPDVNSEVTAKPGEKAAPKKDVHSEETFKPGGAQKPEATAKPKEEGKSGSRDSGSGLGVKTTFVQPTAHGHVMNFLRQLFSPGSQPAGEGQQIASASQHFMQKSEAAFEESMKAYGSGKAKAGKDGLIGKTKSGKNIQHAHFHPDHDNYTSQDHLDAAALHQSRAESPGRSPGAYKIHMNEVKEHKALAAKKAKASPDMAKSEEKTEKESIGATASKIKESAKKAPPAEKAKLLTTPENYPEHNRKKVLSMLKNYSMNKKCD